MKHKKIEDIVEDRFKKISDAYDKARLHFIEDDIRIFRVKVKKLAACLHLICAAEEHHHVKLPPKIEKINQLFGAIRILQMQQNHVFSTIKEYQTGSPDTYLKLISDQILENMEDINKHVKGMKPFKKAEEQLLKVLPKKLSPESILQFVGLEGDNLEKLFNPVFPADQSFHKARKHLKNLLYISPYTDLEIKILSPYKLLSSFEEIDSFSKLLGNFHDLNTAVDCLYRHTNKFEPGEHEKAILRRQEQIWVKAKEGLRIKIYEEMQKIVASGRTDRPQLYSR